MRLYYRFFGCLFGLLLCFALPLAAQPHQSPSVAAILNSDGSIRPGTPGSFDVSGYRLYYGPNGDPRLRPSAAGDEHWRDGFSVAGTDREVQAIAVAPNGDLYISGAFQYVCEIEAPRIARWDGQRWYSLPGGSTTGIISALAFIGNDLYVGGDFNAIGSMLCDGLARWDGTTWHTVPGFSGVVFAMAASNNLLYVGSWLRSGAATVISRWDSNSWQPLGTVAGNVFAMTAAGNNLYVGGRLINVNGVPTRNIAHWNGTQWQALGAGVDTTVFALTILGNDLYAGGRFTQAGGQPATGLARWNGTAWSAPGGGHYIVKAMAAVGNDLYVNSLSANSLYFSTEISRWDGVSWTRLDGPSFSYMTTFPSSYMIASGNHLFVAGKMARGNSIFRWDGSTWNPLSGGGLSGAVYAVACLGSNVYVGGNFIQAGNVPAHYLARWDGTQWHALPGSPNKSVRALRVQGNDLFVGGDFTQIGNLSTNHIARWDGNQWHAMSGGVDGPVNAIATTSADVFVAGMFTQADGAAASCIARWDGSNWHPLGAGLRATHPLSYSPVVATLCATDSVLYAGGQFDSAGSVPAASLARWNGSTWASIGNLQRYSLVTAIAAVDSGLFVGGWSLSIAGDVAALGFWNNHSWLPMITAATNADGFGVNSLVVNEKNLYVAGDFWAYRGLSSYNIIRWSNSQWQPLGSGLASGVFSIDVVDSTVYAGGSFLQIGDQSRWSGYFAIYDPAYQYVNGLPAEAADRPRLLLSPNPTPAGRIRLTGTRATTATILDAAGRTVRQTSIGFDGTLDVRGLPAGLYLVRAGDATARLVVE